MPRLRSDSSRPYPGRSARISVQPIYGSRTEAQLERAGTTTESYGLIGSAVCSNARCNRAEVSRGHSSSGPNPTPLFRSLEE